MQNNRSCVDVLWDSFETSSFSTVSQWCWTSMSPTTARRWEPEPSRSCTNTSRPTTASPSASASGRYRRLAVIALPTDSAAPTAAVEMFLMFLLRSPRPSTCWCAGTWTVPPRRSSRNTCPGSQTTSGGWKLVCARVDVLGSHAQRSKPIGNCLSVPGSDWTAWKCRYDEFGPLCSLQGCCSLVTKVSPHLLG